MNRLLLLAPGRSELIPWTDRRGRTSPLRAIVFALLLAPAAWLVFRWVFGLLGPERIVAATHSTGWWTVWFLLASLAISPARAVAALPNLVVIRRMTGNAALFYGLIHIGLYCTDQHWRMGTVVSEILNRIYLTIGFVALLGMLALGLTSTDGWIKGLGRSWKRLHRIVYAVALLGLVHYVLQSKLDVSQALLAAGVFAWLMLWRVVPAGRDRDWKAMLGLAIGAALLTLAFEYGWYRFGTRINPMKVLWSEFDVRFGLRPAGQVLMLGLTASVIVELRRLGQSAFGGTVLFTMLVYASGTFTDDLLALFMGWSLDDVTPESTTPAVLELIWLIFLALLGVARWRLRNQWQRWMIDAVWLACLLYQVLLVATGSRNFGMSCAALIVVASALLGQRVWLVSRGAALLLIPLGCLLAYEAASFM